MTSTQLSAAELRAAFAERVQELVPDDPDSEPPVQEIRTALLAQMIPIIAGWQGIGAHVSGRSKLGGLPDLPDSVTWPKNQGDGKSLSFLLQINLRQLADADPTSELGLPRQGMYYLFALCAKASAQMYIMGARNIAVVFVAEPAPVAARAFPDDLPEAGRLDAVTLTFGPSLMFEQRVEPTPDESEEDAGLKLRVRYQRSSFDYAVERNIDALLKQLGSHPPDFKLVKNPWFFRDEAADQFDPERQVELLSFHGDLVSLQYRGCTFHVVIAREQLERGALDKSEVIFEV